MSNLDRSRSRRTALLALAALVLISILVVRASGASFNWPLFLNTIQDVSWPWLAASITLMLLTYVGRALRWEVMLRPLGAKVGMARLTSDTAIGFMAATVLGRVGELVRPYLIAASAKVSFSSQVAAWFLERLLDMLAVLLIFGFALMRVPAHGLSLGPGLRWTLSIGGYLAALAGVLCLALLLVFRNFSETALERLRAALGFLPPKYYSRIVELLTRFSQGVTATKDTALLGRLVSYTALEWGLITGSYLALFHSFAATRFLKLADVVTVFGFVAFGSIVQIPGIGGGIQLTTIIVLREIYGISLEAASGIALFLWVVTFLVIVPLGLACAVSQGLTWRKIKQLAAAGLPGEDQLP